MKRFKASKSKSITFQSPQLQALQGVEEAPAIPAASLAGAVHGHHDLREALPQVQNVGLGAVAALIARGELQYCPVENVFGYALSEGEFDALAGRAHAS